MRKQKGSPCGEVPHRLVQDEAGQTLLEILLAFGVSIMVLSAIVVGITTSLSNTQYTKNQNQANSYAQEGMSVVRQIRDSSWNNFKNLKDFTTNITYCLNQGSTELTPKSSLSSVPCGQNVGIFSREVKFNHDEDSSGDCSGGSKATVTVSWSDSKCPAGAGNPLCHKVELITCFSSIGQRQTP